MTSEAIEKRFFLYTLLFTLLLGVLLTDLFLFGPQYFPTGNMAIFYHLLIHHDFWAFPLFLLTLAIAFFFRRKFRLVSGIISFFTNKPFHISVIVFVLLCLGTLVVYQNHPLSMDEYIALFQAKVYASGKLTGEWPLELLPNLAYGGTDNKFLLSSAENGYAISKYWPGFSILLAPFVFLGIPWALNPLICAGSLLILHYFARQIFPYHRDAPGWALLLTIASPQVILNSISYYSMPAHLFFSLAYAALLAKPTAKRMFFAGIIGSFALMIQNPFPHLIFAFPWFLYLVLHKDHRRYVFYLIFGYIPLLLVIAPLYIHSRELVFGAFSKVGAISAESDVSPSGNIFNLLSDTLKTMFMVVTKPRYGILWVRLLCFIKIWFWAVPGLITLSAFGVFKNWNRYPFNVLMGSSFLIFLATFFYGASQGHGWGYRYFHQCWMVFPLLATLAIISFSQTPDHKTASTSSHSNLPQTIVYICLFSLIICNSVRLGQVYSHIDDHLGTLPHIDKNKYQIVFIQHGFYTTDLIQNDPFLRDPVLYLDSNGTENDRKLISTYFPNAKQKSDILWELNKHPLEILNDYRQEHESFEKNPEKSPSEAKT